MLPSKNNNLSTSPGTAISINSPKWTTYITWTTFQPTKQYTHLHQPLNHTTLPLMHIYPLSNHILLRHLSPISPLPSRHFRTNIVLNKLKHHFKECWAYEKSSSVKLNLFYSSFKQSFVKEPYLDLVTNPAFRFRTTRLRISSHDLDVETGRYKNLPRDQRNCKWCTVSLGSKFVEDEKHFLFECDLYSELRSTFLSDLINCSKHTELLIRNHEPIADNVDVRKVHQDVLSKLLVPEDITLKSLPLIVQYLQSADTYVSSNPSSLDNDLYYNITTLAYHIHPPINLLQTNRNDYNTNEKTLSNELWSAVRLHTLNSISTFIGRCFDKRWKFLKECDQKIESKTITKIDTKTDLKTD